MNTELVTAAAVVVKIVVDVIKTAAPGLQGRWTQVVTLPLALGAAIWITGWHEPLAFLSSIAAIWFGAMGVDQLAKRVV